jgi:SulP family sulfate permease
MRRMAEVTNVSAVTSELEDGDDPYTPAANSIRRTSVPPGVNIFDVNGPFFFGAVATFKDTIGRIAGNPKVLIIQLRNVPAIDSTGMHALRDVVKRSRGEGTRVLLAGVQPQPLAALTRAGMTEEIGASNIFAGIDEALEGARRYIAAS